jgi:hypothetical protein
MGNCRLTLEDDHDVVIADVVVDDLAHGSSQLVREIYDRVDLATGSGGG